jgi:hypothetical protein
VYKPVERNYHSLVPRLRKRVNRLTIAVEALRACAVVGGGDIMFGGLLSPALTTFGSAANTICGIRSMYCEVEIVNWARPCYEPSPNSRLKSEGGEDP